MNQLPDYYINGRHRDITRALGGSFMAASCIAVALRVYTRTMIRRCWGWDDWTMLWTLAIYITECVVLFMLVDVESKPVTLENLEEFAKFITAEQALYIAGTIMLKTSLALFFLRFLAERWARWTVWISVVLYSTLAFAMMLLAIFRCGVPRNFVVAEATGKCLPFRVLEITGYVHGALNASTDWVFPLLAVHFLRKTKISPLAKASCCAILFLAVVGSVASIVRTIYIPSIGPDGNIYSNSMKILVWTIVEGGTGIVAASSATFRPLFQRCSAKTKAALSSAKTKSEKPSLLSNLTCFGSARPLAVSTDESDIEKCDTKNLGSGVCVRTKPLHIGILSSVGIETERDTTTGMSDATMKVTKSTFDV